jgi:hypothetical protein
MDEGNGKHHLLGNGYRLDLVSGPTAIVLRREDGSEVARFSVWDATSSAIEQAAEKDYRSTREAEARL